MPSQQVLATTPAALHALTLHMIEHNLPTPYAIDTPLATNDDNLKVTVPGWELDRWATSIAIDTDEAGEPDRHGIHRRHIHGRLPDFGVAVHINGILSPGATALIARLNEASA